MDDALFARLSATFQRLVDENAVRVLGGIIERWQHQLRAIHDPRAQWCEVVQAIVFYETDGDAWAAQRAHAAAHHGVVEHHERPREETLN